MSHVNRCTAVLLVCLIATTSAEAQMPSAAGSVAASPDKRQAARAVRRPTRPAPKAVPAETLAPSKAVTYGPRDVVALRTKLRYTTLLILPKDEVILDFICGDKDFWSIEGELNFVYIRPSTEGLKTNLNLVTASGNVYSFLLNEVSGTSAAPDLKVFVEVKDAAMVEAAASPKRLVSVKELEGARDALAQAKAETEQVRQGAREAIDKGVEEFVTNVRFAYRFEAGKKPFGVRAMYHDDRFTYIRARPEETPTLYELKDGKPNLVNFDYDDRGVYIVPKILDEGYLAIGRKRLAFKREE